MTRIKICGITNRDDARAAIEAGTNALGVIAVPESPRYVSAERARAIFDEAGLLTPVVIVARTVRDADGYGDTPGIVQFYSGDADPFMPAIRAFRVRDAASLSELEAYGEPVGGILLDTYHEAALGGVGQTFDWSLAVAAKALLRERKLILAGGLTPENVGAAVAAVRPYAVDVSSGVEAEPGRKDHDKIRRFIRAVREADALPDR